LEGREEEAITKQVFTKANGLLKEVAEQIEHKQGSSSKEILSRLDNYQTEVALLASVVRRLKGVGISEIKNASLNVLDSSQLLNWQKERMETVFILNRLKLYPGGLKDYTVEEFRKKLNTAGNEFYIFEYKEHPTVFFHVEKETPDTWYVGSLNLGPEAFDSPLAVAVIKAALEKEGGRHNLRAVVYEKNPARSFYTRLLGFKETGKVNTVADDAGQEYRYIELLRPKAFAG
jgi:hypothetical protein